MRNSTHEVIGATGAAALGLAIGATPLVMVGLVVSSLPGSWLPDADTEGSRVHRLSQAERRHPAVRVAALPARLPLWLIKKLARHREATHTAVACLLMPSGIACVYGVPLLPLPVAGVLWGGLTVGYVLHLCADGVTVAGIPLWAPWSEKQVHLLPAKWRFRTLRPIHPREARLAQVMSLILTMELLAWIPASPSSMW